jgi:tetratricopeptide (TPR) repeat protein
MARFMRYSTEGLVPYTVLLDEPIIESKWKLLLFGNFELRRPEGACVPIGNRKVQGLLAILAMNRGGLSRSEIAQILWPELAAESRGNNLRQTLIRAHNALGPAVIDSSRTHCRLADTFSFVCDWYDESLRTSPVFMPGFDGAWFESARRGNQAVGAQLAGKTLLMSSFLNVLEWLVQHDPSRMLGLMRENLGLSLGISLEDRRRLVSQVSEDRTLPGWRMFFTAGMLDGGYAQAAERFKTVLDAALSNKDLLLAVQASAQLSYCAMMQNRLADAEAFANYCAAIAAKAGDPNVLPTATQAQGMVLIHAGRPAEGLPLLERAEQQYLVYIDSVIIQTLRGFYLSSYGKSREAEKCLASARKVRSETGHALLNVLCVMTEAEIRARDSDPRDSIDELERAVRFSEEHQDPRHTVVSHEELAKAYLRSGQIPRARQRIIEARKLRRSMAMGYTPWDQMRLSARS